MRWTIVVPGALLPAAWAADVVPAIDAPGLVGALVRARRQPSAVSVDPQRVLPTTQWLWQALSAETSTPVTAPYAARACGLIEDGSRQVWQCDPVHFAFARDHMLVTPLDGAAPTHEEAAALFADAGSAARTLGPAPGATLDSAPGVQLRRGSDPAAWFLLCDPPWSLGTVSLDAARGQSVQACWPTGADAPRWRRLLTDVQMRWHEHPVNQAREARQLPTVNGLWLHGAGAWRALPQAPFDLLLGGSPALRGWCLAAGLSAERLHEHDAIPAALTETRAVLQVFDALQASAVAEHWGAWLAWWPPLAAVVARAIDVALSRSGEVDLVLGGQHSVRVLRIAAANHWRFWQTWRKATPAALQPLLREEPAA
jgi:hypothetical protein